MRLSEEVEAAGPRGGGSITQQNCKSKRGVIRLARPCRRRRLLTHLLVERIARMSKALKRSKSSEPAPSVADLQTEIRERGMRSTGPRVAVLAHLDKASSPLSHTEIFEALADRGYDRATIYRNLMDLAEAGLLARLSFGGPRVALRAQARDGQSLGVGTRTSSARTRGEVSCLPDLSVTVVAASGAFRSRWGPSASRCMSRACATTARRNQLQFIA